MNSVILFASVDSSSLSFSRAWWRLLAFSQKYRKAYTKGHVAGTWSGDMLQRQFSSCDMPVFTKIGSVAGDKILFPQRVIWDSAGLNHEAGTKWPQFSTSHRVHCPCKLFPLQHINEPISASCAPACVLSLEHGSYAYTLRGLSPLHVAATYPLVCADL